ncbi:hypothetical protein MM1218R_01544 [Mycobacterium marinum]|nr:hypothetical protein MM1218R_01544 [Mycobacterium marinum]RFZ11456.1 hypothetical protein DE4381_01044 [Mycobacterium marinum]
MAKACACARYGFESGCTDGAWTDRHPPAAVFGGLLTLIWTSMMLTVYPIAGLTIIAVVAAAAGVRMLIRKRRRQQALVARADWDYRAAIARRQQAPAVPDAARQMRRTAWQPDVWSAEQPLSPQLPPRGAASQPRAMARRHPMAHTKVRQLLMTRLTSSTELLLLTLATSVYRLASTPRVHAAPPGSLYQSPSWHDPCSGVPPWAQQMGTNWSAVDGRPGIWVPHRFTPVTQQATLRPVHRLSRACPIS